jgi:hypothetical protein
MMHSIRCSVAATAFVTITSSMTAQSPTFNSYLHDLARPGVFAGVIGGSLMDQIRGRHDSLDFDDRDSAAAWSHDRSAGQGSPSAPRSRSASTRS